MANNEAVVVGMPIKVSKRTPNIDFKYGPYLSKEYAHNILGENNMDVIVEGLTIGIIENDNIVEYWYQGGRAFENLVRKNSISDAIISVELKDMAAGTLIPKHASYCTFTFDGEATFVAPCVYDDANCVLVSCRIKRSGIIINKVYLIAGRYILNVWNGDNIPDWVIPYIPKNNAEMLREVYDALSVKINEE